MQKGKNYFHDVVLWHLAAGHPVRDKPVVLDPSKEDLASYALGMDLVKEEFKELCVADSTTDLREMTDACGDLIWVVCGLMARLGVNLDAAWEEIRRTNWEKLGGPVREDGKLLKPEGWKPPSMEKAIAGIPEEDR